MSDPQSPQRQSTPTEADHYVRTLHVAALIALIACPALALIPPRKLDLYTFGLVGTTAFSANYLTQERTGRSLWQVAAGQKSKPSTTAAAVVGVMEQEGLGRELRDARLEMQRSRSLVGSEEVSGRYSAREAWKEQREKEIRDDLDVGKGFGEMITDQIWEVWNWRKKDRDEDDEGNR